MSQIPFGIELGGEGAHPAAWRHADSAPSALHTPARIRERFRALDDSSLAFVTIPQAHGTGAFPNVQGQLDSIETAIYAAAVTSRISVNAEGNAIHAEPFHLANQLNTLDWAAKGRSGWIVGTDDSAEVAASYGREPHSDLSAPLRETREVVQTIRRLWDTWEDDIFLADEATHRFLDLDLWHYADFEGEFFKIKGPGLLPRPPQGQLPIWSRGTGESIASLIDIVLLSGRDIGGIAEAARVAREKGAPRVVAEVEIVIDAGGQSASERLAQLDRWTPWASGERFRLVGSVDEAVAQLTELAAHVDGVQLHPAVIDADLPVIIGSLLPALDRAGILLAEAATQRELFGLERPSNIFAIA